MSMESRIESMAALRQGMSPQGAAQRRYLELDKELNTTADSLSAQLVDRLKRVDEVLADLLNQFREMQTDLPSQDDVQRLQRSVENLTAIRTSLKDKLKQYSEELVREQSNIAKTEAILNDVTLKFNNTPKQSVVEQEINKAYAQYWDGKKIHRRVG